MKALKVVKIGGKVIDDEKKLKDFLKAFSELKGAKLLVHGGGSIATKLGDKMGIKAQMIDGRRVTNQETLDLVTMVYGGLVNKNIVAKLQALGKNAVGCSGADLNLISAKKRSAVPVDFGYVGDIEKVEVDWLMEFLRHDIIPVLAPLTHDNRGNMLNTNADSVASFVASALAEFYAVELMLCFEQKGVMNKGKTVKEIDEQLFQSLKGSKVITDGMIPKLDVGFEALTKGVRSVSIRDFNSVNKKSAGTKLVL